MILTRVDGKITFLVCSFKREDHLSFMKGVIAVLLSLWLISPSTLSLFSEWACSHKLQWKVGTVHGKCFLVFFQDCEHDLIRQLLLLSVVIGNLFFLWKTCLNFFYSSFSKKSTTKLKFFLAISWNSQWKLPTKTWKFLTYNVYFCQNLSQTNILTDVL